MSPIRVCPAVPATAPFLTIDRSIAHMKTRVASRLIGLLTVFALLSALTGQPALADQSDSSLEILLKRGVVRVADTQSSPPWSYLGADNQPTGYDVAVAREIFRRIGVAKVELIADSFKNFVEGIRTQKYDVVVNSLARTSEREKAVDFTIPYSVQDFRIWVKDTTSTISTADSLKGLKVGVSSGTSNEVWARKNLLQSEIKTYENGGFVYNDLATGRLDAVIDSYTNGYHNKTVNHLPIKPVGNPLVYSLGAAVVPKNAVALKDAMNKAIQEMISDGTLQRIAHQYFGPDYDMVGNMKKGASLN
jgi:cystine transport system substrate-binding protein